MSKNRIKGELSIDKYQKLAARTSRQEELTQIELLENVGLGLAGESGEVADIIKKVKFQGHEFNKEHLLEELGDIAWYLALGATAMGVSLSDIFQGNINKLEKRYPDNKFSSEASIERKDK